MTTKQCSACIACLYVYSHDVHTKYSGTLVHSMCIRRIHGYVTYRGLKILPAACHALQMLCACVSIAYACANVINDWNPIHVLLLFICRLLLLLILQLCGTRKTNFKLIPVFEHTGNDIERTRLWCDIHLDLFIGSVWVALEKEMFIFCSTITLVANISIFNFNRLNR